MKRPDFTDEESEVGDLPKLFILDSWAQERKNQDKDPSGLTSYPAFSPSQSLAAQCAELILIMFFHKPSKVAESHCYSRYGHNTG